MRSINEHKQERGVTILLVAVCLAALLAMAAWLSTWLRSM